MRRIVHLEELLKKPILQSSRIPAETLVELHAVPTPISDSQLRRSLERDVGYPIIRTNSNLFFKNPYIRHAKEYEKAARLIKETLMSYRHAPEWKGKGLKYLYVKAGQFILEECEIMSKEIQSGQSDRNNLEYLMGEEYFNNERLKDKMEHINRVFEQIRLNTNLHPVMKRGIMQHICRILLEAK